MKDPYIDENDVLINKLKIKTYKKLNEAEADIGFLKLMNVDSLETDIFDEELIKQIHKHILEDIFDWAGEYRTVPLVKSELVLPGYSVPYSSPRNIEKDLRVQLRKLNEINWSALTKEEIAMVFARRLALIWKVHPFRDGNTRTILSFAYLYAKKHDFPLDMETFTEELSRRYDEQGNVLKYSIRDKFVLASLEEKDEPEIIHLARVFEKSMKRVEDAKNKQTLQERRR